MQHIDTFRSDVPTPRCRVCEGAFSSQSVISGAGPYETRWRRCGACGSWSVDRVPVPHLLDRFYQDYRTHLRLSAVNPDNNDGRRYTPQWRQTREQEYRLGLADVGVELRAGLRVVDLGAQDAVFLDLCRALQPALLETKAVDYDITGMRGLEALGHSYEQIDAWLDGELAVDLVTLWDVYEHVPEPARLMRALARRVVKGGQVLVQTPRAALHADILGPLWHHFLPVQHLQLPSREGLLAQFRQYDFAAARACSFGANAPPSLIPQPYKRLFDSIAKSADLGSTQIVRFIHQ